MMEKNYNQVSSFNEIGALVPISFIEETGL